MSELIREEVRFVTASGAKRMRYIYRCEECGGEAVCFSRKITSKAVCIECRRKKESEYQKQHNYKQGFEDGVNALKDQLYKTLGVEMVPLIERVCKEVSV